MSHTITRGRYGRKQFDGSITYHEILGLDRHWDREDEDAVFGEYHTKSQQNGIDGTRGSYGSPTIQQSRQIVRYREYIANRDARHNVRHLHIKLHKLRCFLKQTSTHATCNVIKKEFLCSPHSFYHTAKHPEGKHIEENVFETSMHKHVSKELINLKVGSQKEMEPENIIQSIATTGILTHKESKQEGYDIHYQQVLCNYRYIAHL